MPTYDQLMSCAPQDYQAAGQALSAFATRLSTSEQSVHAQFGSATAAGTWTGPARDAADRYGQELAASLDQLGQEVRNAAQALEQAGQEITAAQTELRTLSAEIRAQ